MVRLAMANRIVRESHQGHNRVLNLARVKLIFFSKRNYFSGITGLTTGNFAINVKRSFRNLEDRTLCSIQSLIKHWKSVQD